MDLRLCYNGAMRVELLTIGSELISGATVNTNAAYLTRRLLDIGLACRRQTTVSDERAGLIATLRETLDRCDLLITTGGLGPTFDDITVESLAEATAQPLTLRADVANTIRRFYHKHHRAIQRAALRQALLPRDSSPIPNPLGTAPGIWLPLGDKIVVALPGVPAEMRAMTERTVLPRLKRTKRGQAVESRTLRTAGLVELSIEAILNQLRLPEQIQIGLYPHLRMVDVRLTVMDRSRRAARTLIAHAEAQLRRRLGNTLYGTDEETLEEVIGKLLVLRRKTLAVAESCTGGLVSDRLTNVSGSSRYLRGSVVAYHNDLKRRLGVSERTLQRFGAVSAQAAKEMAAGIRRFAHADIGLSITGIAGPTGGTPKKPVGLVHLGLSDGRRTRTIQRQFFGDRSAIKTQAAQTALDWLRQALLTIPASRRR